VAQLEEEDDDNSSGECLPLDLFRLLRCFPFPLVMLCDIIIVFIAGELTTGTYVLTVSVFVSMVPPDCAMVTSASILRADGEVFGRSSP